MKHIKNLFALFLLLNLSLHAQVKYDQRIEKDLSGDFENHDIIPFGKEGVIMQSQSKKSSKGKNQWKFEQLDNNLKTIKTEIVELPSSMFLDETFKGDDRVYYFFKDRKGQFSIISVKPGSLKLSKVDGMLPKKTWVKDMLVVGEVAVFNASVKGKPCLFKVNWLSGTVGVTPIEITNVKTKNLHIKNFQKLKNSNEILVFVKVFIDRKTTEMYVIRLDENGKKSNVINLSKNLDKNVVSISASKTKSGKYIYTGTYATKGSYYSEGLFFAEGEKGGFKFIKFYNFLDLKNFTSYLPERQQKKIERKKKKKADQGKEFSISYLIVDHDIVEKEDGYIFLGEACYPTYRQEAYTTTTFVNGQAVTRTQYRTVFDGYQYTHAIIAKFSTTGELVWDNSFELNTYKPFYLKQFIKIAEEQEAQVKLVYASGAAITSKTIDLVNGTELASEKKTDIETGNENEKIKRSYSHIEYWYDNFFIAYGFQKIKNEDREKRFVFFCSKVRY